MSKALTNFLLARCEGLMAGLKAVSLWLFVILGVAIIGASIGVAFYMPVQFAAVLVAAIGSMIGTAVGSLGFAKLVNMVGERKKAEVEQQAETLLREKIDMENRIKEVGKLEAEKAAMAEEIRRLEQMRVNVDHFRPILKLGLMELDASITDFWLKEVQKSSGSVVSRNQLDEYLGVVKANFHARFGIDLNRLRFREEDQGTLVISGIESEFQGFMDLEKEWLLKEVRVRRTGGPLADDYLVHSQDGRLADLIIEHEKSLQGRINKGLHLESVDAGIRRLAKEFLSLLFLRLGKRLVFAEHDERPGLGLIEYLDDYNRKLEGRIDQQRKALSGSAEARA